jgi:aspartyl-tRNA(Asn)/glutamyl-tRNA(Gln) amidotransferase subunit B
LPIASNGYLDIVKKDGSVKRIGIKRLHMEEDAGKLLHLTKTGQIGEAEASLVDYNRAGVPLIEIVSEPDIRTSEEAYLYLSSLKSIMRYIDISDCNMEEGSLRCDANISVRKTGDEKLGVKVEIKNMNSFKNVQKALDYEAERQIKLLEENEKIVQETRLWDPGKEKTFSMRSKEESHDYRYFPEPDLPPMEINDEIIEKIRKEIPELPQEKFKRFIKEYNLPEYDASVLTADKEISLFYEEAVKISKDSKLTSNWIMTELLRKMNENNIEDLSMIKVTAENLGELILLIKNGTISGKIAKTVFDEMFKSGVEPEKIVKEKGLTQITDTKEIEAIIDKVLNENQNLVAEIKARGKANPQMVNEILRKKISG